MHRRVRRSGPRHGRRRQVAVRGALVALWAVLGAGLAAPAAGADPATTAPAISHVVVIIQENHSFDNVLGKFCTEVSSREVVRPGPERGV